MDENLRKNFRAIVVGGGVTGLVASHAFTKAGIEHVVLERGSEAAPAHGASIAIYPHGARILQQLGLLGLTSVIADPLEDGASNRWPDGSLLQWTDLWRFVRENHGYELMLLERRGFLEVLWENLPDKSKVLFRKEVTNVVEDDSGVEVFLSDGTSEKGDIVVGADGVHSTVREAMWTHANKLQPGIIDVKEKKAISTQWTCLLGFGPGEPQMKNELSVVYNKGQSFLLGTQPRHCFYFLFQRVKKPWSRYTRPRYTQEDAERVASSVADMPISDSMVFGELWKKKHRGALVDIEEGILSRWHYGRTVLVGDTAHKITPNMALGGNSGMESVVVLTNHLRRMLEQQHDGRPTKTSLNTTFKAYQDERLPRMRRIMEFSSLISRVQAWDNLFLKWMSIYFLPYLPERKLANDLGEIIRKAPKLDFIPLDQWNESLLEWEDMKVEETKKAGMVQYAQLPLFGAMLVMSSLVWIMNSRGMLHGWIL